MLMQDCILIRCNNLSKQGLPQLMAPIALFNVVVITFQNKVFHNSYKFETKANVVVITFQNKVFHNTFVALKDEESVVITFQNKVFHN